MFFYPDEIEKKKGYFGYLFFYNMKGKELHSNI